MSAFFGALAAVGAERLARRLGSLAIGGGVGGAGVRAVADGMVAGDGD